MHIILGGTGHVGSAVANALLARNEPVTIVSHDPVKGEAWKAKGAKIAIADVHDVEALRFVFQSGRRAFLLNPPAAPHTDTDAEEKGTVAAILAAVADSGLEKLVAESTYGAQPGERRGDLNTLWELEHGLAAQPIPYAVNRGAYYYTNWAASLAEARDEGVLRTMFDADFELPMVAPEDLGAHAAALMSDERLQERSEQLAETAFIGGPKGDFVRVGSLGFQVLLAEETSNCAASSGRIAWVLYNRANVAMPATKSATTTRR